MHMRAHMSANMHMRVCQNAYSQKKILKTCNKKLGKRVGRIHMASTQGPAQIDHNTELELKRERKNVA